MTIGITKKIRVDSLSRIYESRNIPYKRKDLENMSLSQLSRKIRELTNSRKRVMHSKKKHIDDITID